MFGDWIFYFRSMKAWLKSAISIFLGMLILVTGSGISLAKMVCLKSGHIEFSLNEPDDCCPRSEHKADVTIDEKCCDISSINVDVLHYIVSATQSIEKSVALFDIPSGIVFDFVSLEHVNTSHFCGLSDPPELSTPPIRIFTKSFLI